MGRGKAKPKARPDTAPAKPLYEWFDADKANRAKLRQAGYSDGRITNWKSRGIPLAELWRVANHMGISHDEYLALAGVSAPKLDGPVSPSLEEAHAIRRLRKALPQYRAYVLSLALMESHEKQRLFLDIMSE